MDNITVRTFNSGEVTFNLKQLHSLYLNEIVVKFNYSSWLKDGKLEINKYLLHPESLKTLIDLIKTNKLESKFNIRQSEVFLKKFPTYKKLKQSLDNNLKLPSD